MTSPYKEGSNSILCTIIIKTIGGRGVFFKGKPTALVVDVVETAHLKGDYTEAVRNIKISI